MALPAEVLAGVDTPSESRGHRNRKSTDKTVVIRGHPIIPLLSCFTAQDTLNKIKIAPASADRSGAPEIK